MLFLYILIKSFVYEPLNFERALLFTVRKSNTKPKVKKADLFIKYFFILIIYLNHHLNFIFFMGGLIIQQATLMNFYNKNLSWKYIFFKLVVFIR